MARARVRRWLAALAAVSGLLGGAGAWSVTVARGAQACGAAATAVRADVDAQVMAAVQRVELDGPEVRADLAHVISSTALEDAVADSNAAATYLAVHALVYHAHWHIVRLRVSSATGRLLADIGGPDVVSPVSAVLRRNGVVTGRVLMSVQDDVGIVKLERAFIGDYAGLYGGETLITGVPGTLPPGLPRSGYLRVGGVRSLIRSQNLAAFPSGVVRLALLVPPVPASVAAQPCDLVRADEFGSVALHLSRDFPPLAGNYPPYAQTLTRYTDALVFVRSGSKQLASTGGAGPAKLPLSGSIGYRGRTWDVVSLAPAPPARIYLLVGAARA